jgi:IMP cyclohydrolase
MTYKKLHNRSEDMFDLTIEKDKIKVNLKALKVGNDLCVIIAGGDSPHIGAVTLSCPRPSLADHNKISATTSSLAILGHKDDEAARYVSQTLASSLNKNVVVSCGIHVDNITDAGIQTVMRILKELVETLVAKIS